MAISRVGSNQTVGTVTTSITAALPAGTQASDLCLIALVGKDATTTVPADPAGWVGVSVATGSGQGQTTGNDSGNAFLYVYGKILAGGDAAPTFNAGATAPNSWSALSVAYRSSTFGWHLRSTPAGTSSMAVSGPQDTTIASPLTGTAVIQNAFLPAAGDVICMFGSIPTDLGSAIGASSATETGLSGGTITNLQYVETALGNDSAGALWDWTGFTGTASTGSITISVTITGASNNNGSLAAFALRDAVGTPPSGPPDRIRQPAGAGNSRGSAVHRAARQRASR